MSGVLLDAIRETLGDRWTPEVEDAWHDGLTAVITVMLQAHRGMPTTAPPDGRPADCPAGNHGTSERRAPELVVATPPISRATRAIGHAP
jgi:hypothetical protein